MEVIRVLLIFLFSTLSFGKPGILFQKKVFESFKFCLITNGLSSNSIVERDNAEAYNGLNYQWQQKPPFITPLAYVLVQNAGNVVAVVSCGRVWNVHLMPKGGGHSFEKYSFGDSNSVVVDLRNLKTLEMNKSKMSVRVGAGWLIGPLNFELWKMAQVFIAVTECPTVGIVGLATGGGYSFFSRELGLIGDNIQSVKIVTANGHLLTANKKKNPDLFWALRGGVASNFGIITQLKFKIYPAPPATFYGSLTYDMTKLSPVWNAWQKWAHRLSKSTTTQLDITNGQIIVTVSDSTGDASNFEKFKRKFPKTGNRSTFVLAYPEFNVMLYRNLSGEKLSRETMVGSFPDFAQLNTDSPGKVYHKRKSFYVEKKIGSAQRCLLKSYIEGMPSTVSIFFESYGGAINNLQENATAFVHRGRTLYNVVVQYKNYMSNRTGADEMGGRRWVEGFYELSKTIFQHKKTYQNYVDGELGDYLERYFGSNLGRLVQVKRKYDPQNYWRNPQSIPTHMTH